MITYQQNTQQLEEHSAVNRLLEMADRRDPSEDSWNERERLRLLGSMLGRRAPRSIERESRQFHSLQKKLDRERLKELSDVHNPQPHYPRSRYLVEHLRVSMELSKNIRIRPINSNLTFYSPEKITAASLTFYRNHSRLDQPPLPIQPAVNSIASNRIVYFKSNKAETVRQLLKEMKYQRGNQNQILLHSTNGKTPKGEGQGFHQLEQPHVTLAHREDQQLFRTGVRSEEENIWKKKMRAARSRRMGELQRKHDASKKLILRD